MAKIIPLLGEIVGSIAGNTFQRNKSGQTVRSRPRVTKRSTGKQTIWHQNHQRFLHKWQTLTQPQRDDWNTYSTTWTKDNKFGQTKTLTGANWYEAINSISFNVDGVFVDSPPAHTLPDAVPNYEIIATADKLYIHLLASFDETNNYLYVWCCPPTLGNTFSQNRIRKLIGKVMVLGETYIDVTSEWEKATEMSYNPIGSFPSCNLFFFIQTISRTSYITSPMLFKSCNTANTFTWESTLNAYIAYYTNPPTPTRQVILNNFFRCLRLTNNFKWLDRMYLFATEEEQQASISLKNPSSTPLTPVNSPTWDPLGYTGNGFDMYLDTNFNPLTQGFRWNAASQMIGVYVNQGAIEAGIDTGLEDTVNSSFIRIYTQQLGNFFRGMLLDVTNLDYTVSSPLGFSAIRKNQVNDRYLTRNATDVATDNVASNIYTGGNVYVLASNRDGTAATFSTKRIAAFVIGGDGLLDSSNFYDCLLTLLTAIGAE